MKGDALESALAESRTSIGPEEAKEIKCKT
jgi:hypothetical protein